VIEVFEQIDVIIDKKAARPEDRVQKNAVLRGHTQFVMRDALKHGNTNQMALFLLDQNMKCIGKTYLTNCAARRFYTFFDLRIRNKLNIIPIIAIDYSLANLTFEEAQQCIHTLKEGAPNNYNERTQGFYNAFKTLSKFLLAYGIGACTVKEKGGDACSLFSMTGDFSQPYVSSFEELVNSYSGTIKTVQLALPVNFMSIIKFVCDVAQAELGTVSDATEINNYYVLTILMAGVIDDFEEALQ
jgi:hypothetical protein